MRRVCPENGCRSKGRGTCAGWAHGTPPWITGDTGTVVVCKICLKGRSGWVAETIRLFAVDSPRARRSFNLDSGAVFDAFDTGRQRSSPPLP